MATRKNETKKAPAKKTKPEVKHVSPKLITAVLLGEYGEGAERNARLKAEGYSPSAVTKKINDLAKIAEEIKPGVKKAGEYFGIAVYLACPENIAIVAE